MTACSLVRILYPEVRNDNPLVGNDIIPGRVKCRPVGWLILI